MDSSLYVPESSIKATTTTTPYDCVQEVAHYIDLVYKCWSSIYGAHPGAVTIPTVRTLKGRYPRLSSQDVSYITKSFNDFDVFETVQDKQERSEMLSAVLRWPDWILSLRLLIEDTKIVRVRHLRQRRGVRKRRNLTACKISLGKEVHQRVSSTFRTRRELFQQQYRSGHRRH